MFTTKMLKRLAVVAAFVVAMQSHEVLGQIGASTSETPTVATTQSTTESQAVTISEPADAVPTPTPSVTPVATEIRRHRGSNRPVSHPPRSSPPPRPAPSDFSPRPEAAKRNVSELKESRTPSTTPEERNKHPKPNKPRALRGNDDERDDEDSDLDSNDVLPTA